MREKLAAAVRALLELLALEVWDKTEDDRLREIFADFLNTLPEASRLGTALFNAIWRLFSATAIEVVCFRRVGGVDCVFLSRRKPGDAYEGLLHSAGTLIWAGDTSIQGIVRRLSEGEYGDRDMLHLLTPNPIETKVIDEVRGTMGYMLYLGDLVGDPDPSKGTWVPVSEALVMREGEIVSHHPHLIYMTYCRWQELRATPLNPEQLASVLRCGCEGMATYEEKLQARASMMQMVSEGGMLGPEIWGDFEIGYHGLPRRDGD